ncbi:calcium/proton exchanger [Tanacetum coccineum]
MTRGVSYFTIVGVLKAVGVLVSIVTKRKKIKKSLFPNEDAESSKSAKSAPKSSKKGAKSTKSVGKSAKSAGKSTKSTGKYVKFGIKKKVSFSQPIQTRNKKTGEGCINAGEGSSKSQPSKSPQTSPKTPQTLPKWTKKKIMDAKKSTPVCGFRLWASWMHNEHSFQIKSLHDDHKCPRNYKLGSLVTYKWIAYHFSKDIINDPFIPYIKIRDQIRQRFLIDVSLGQCKRAKQRALYNHEGGLIKHYCRLWDYRQALLESNPGSTCRLKVEEVSSGNTYFNRFYICFKGLKDRRGELLTAMGRDANNEMYPNFKKKYSGLQLQRLFWGAASGTVDELFYAKMDDLKYINLEAYEYLVARNPNSWCRAFSNLNVKCAAFENGISERYHKAILLQRSKPIITMLEDKRIYIMQRLVAINKLPVNLEDQITPTVRKRLEYLKQEQRNCYVFPSAYQELEVRCGDQSYAKNFCLRTCSCRLWQLSGVPCIHAIAGGRGSRGRGRGAIGAESGGRGQMGAESSGGGQMGAESGG